MPFATLVAEAFFKLVTYGGKHGTQRKEKNF